MAENLRYNCVFGGGGTRGLCYIGAVKALEEFNIEIDSIAGSSVGAVFAVLYAIGYSADEIKDMFMNFNINMFLDLNINLFNTDISLSKGEIFLEWLREKIEKKVHGKSGEKVYFKELDKKLQIHALDINSNTPFIFSKYDTPDEEVALAVRISAGLPGLMKPVSLEFSTLVDGDLIKSWPAWKIYDRFNTSDHRILEFRLEGSRDNKNIKNPIDYLNSIISTIWALSTEDVYNSYHDNDRYDFIVIDTKDVILFDFTIDKDTREKLINKGYEVTKYYLSNTLVNKRKNILSVYKKIYASMVDLKKYINSKHIDKALLKINEILSEMYEDTKYIDISIYDKIKELKQLLYKNIKSELFYKTINNHKFIKDTAEFILMLIDERIKDINNYISQVSQM